MDYLLYDVFLFFFFFFKQKTAYEMLRSLVGSEMCIRDRHAMVNVRPAAFGIGLFMFLCALVAPEGESFRDTFSGGMTWSTMCATGAIMLLAVGVADIAIGT
eukprot:TRINITY_DN2091_c0_g1_i2.p1 TRINITY_DN2091_c0_g1~~TRINITY_DN2091_c0_g1_i2.p1  ORF type:complete len:102 (-),score=28.66 TRINITY_DN2091_c0_g1_i2:438-743(-)